MSIIKDKKVKTEIISSAQKLFSRFGLKKTTMDDIAFACGKAKSTLYHYFKSKEEVFGDVIMSEMNGIREKVILGVDQQMRLGEKLKVYFYTYHKCTLENENLLSILKREIQLDVARTQWYQQAIEFEINYLNKLLKDGIKSGELNGIEEDELPWFSETILIAFMGIVKHNIEKEGSFDEYAFFKASDLLISRIIV